MCGCRRKAGPGNIRRTAISPTPVQTRFTANPSLNANKLNQKALTDKIPTNTNPMALNQKVNLNSLNNANRANILRRSIYEQARIKAIKKQEDNNK
jgi:hypothetical protein